MEGKNQDGGIMTYDEFFRMSYILRQCLNWLDDTPDIPAVADGIRQVQRVCLDIYMRGKSEPVAR